LARREDARGLYEATGQGGLIDTKKPERARKAFGLTPKDHAETERWRLKRGRKNSVSPLLYGKKRMTKSKIRDGDQNT